MNTMMKRFTWELKLGIGLVALAVVLHGVHYLFFRDLHHILVWCMTDLAFLPLSVLFVTLIIDGMMRRRDKQLRLDKLNMLIGTFFSAAGRDLILRFAQADPRIATIRERIAAVSQWSSAECAAARAAVVAMPFSMEIGMLDFVALRDVLAARTDFLLRLLENPSMLDHEEFTDLLRAVFHLAEELASRPSFTALPPTDLAHLAGDCARAYRLLACQWIAYMGYLKRAYPYLFSLAIRTNPFDPDASPIVQA